MLKIKEENRGITLIALVITIIVLLILAGISIRALTGENGLLRMAEAAREETKKAEIKEAIDLVVMDEIAKNYDKDKSEWLQELAQKIQEKLHDMGIESGILGSVHTEEGYFNLQVGDDIYKVTQDGVENVTKMSKDEIKIEEGEITFEYSTSGDTNENVKVTIKVNTKKVAEYAIYYKTEKDTDWKAYTKEVEMTENGKIYAKLQGINGTSSVATGTVSNIDKLAPKEFQPTAEATTNSITVTASTEDTDATEETGNYKTSGIEGYRFSIDDGKNWTEYKTGEHKFESLEQNQEYTIRVEAKDKAGNKTEGKVTKSTTSVPGLVESTETQTGNVTFQYSNKNWTNQSVTVTATTTVEGYKLRTSIDGENWSNETSRTFNANGNMYVKLWDGTNYGESATATISNIDTDNPTIGAYSSSAVNCTTAKLTLASATDNASKISKIIWYYKGPSDTSYKSVTTDYTTPTTDITANTSKDISVTFNNNYDTYVEVYDLAGNKATSSNTTAKGNTTHNQVEGGAQKSAATCTSAAVYYYKCSRCNTQLSTTYTSGTASGHTKVQGGNLKTAATCTKAAEYYYKCSVCNAQLTETYTSGSPAGHKKTTGGNLKTAATCTKAAEYYYKCSVCNTQLTETYTSGSPAGHKYTVGVELKDASTEIKNKYNFKTYSLSKVAYGDGTFAHVDGMSKGQIIWNDQSLNHPAYPYAIGYYQLNEQKSSGFLYWTTNYLGASYIVGQKCSVCGAEK